MLTAKQVLQRLRFECSDIGSQAAWAKENGVSPQYVHDVLAGRRAPGDSILKALRLKRIVRYTHEGD